MANRARLLMEVVEAVSESGVQTGSACACHPLATSMT